MTTFPKAKRSERTPGWLKVARGFYGEAFEPARRADLAEAMADWSEMSESERGFVLAHLEYLGLLAQRSTQQMLVRLRAALGEFGDEVLDALEEQGELDDDDDDDDDGDEGEAEGEALDAPDPGRAWQQEQEAAQQEQDDPSEDDDGTEDDQEPAEEPS